MKTKEVRKKAAVTKTAKKNEVSADPFDSIAEPVVESAAPKKRAIKVNKAAAKPVVNKTSSRIQGAEVIEPFAEIAAKSTPVKKRTAKTGTRAIGTVEAKAKPAKKAAVKTTAKKTIKSKEASLDVTAEIAAVEPEVELSPAFKALADVTMPELTRENRARLLMQSPTKLYFYWSVKENLWHQLRNVFGDDLGGYVLALKLKNLTRDSEGIQQCEADGNWWFDVEPDCEYQAEIGFYAVNRPYFRVIYSNSITTPRCSPSPRAATDADWGVSANEFAAVLDVAGFSRDAFDVSMAGDDHAASENASHRALSRFLGTSRYELNGVTAGDIRYAMLALASGATLEELRFKVSPALFAVLQANPDKLEAGNAMSSLTEYFDIDEAEFTEEQTGPAVYGASLVNFPRTLNTRAVSSRYAPMSSHSYR
jgi:hypothetical protein